MISHAGNANFTGIQKKVCPHEYHGNIQYEKSVRIWSYFDPHFTTSLRILSECGLMWTKITPNAETFHAVIIEED